MIRKIGQCLKALTQGWMPRGWGSNSPQSILLKFKFSPFPYQEAPNSQPFFDVLEKGRRGHTSFRAGVYWEDQTYSDNRVLISIPSHFDPTTNPLIIVYLHGNQATLERDVMSRQQIPEQLNQSGLNALLAAPQFALDAQDSSAGHFADKGFFAHFLQEVAEQTGAWKDDRDYTQGLQNAKVILVAYSGGYKAAAHALQNGGVDKRIAGVILLDALYAHGDIFADFIFKYKEQSFFLSCYTQSTQANNLQLQQLLQTKNHLFSTHIPLRIMTGVTSFFYLGDDANHHTFLEQAWVTAPLTDLLKRISLAPTRHI